MIGVVLVTHGNLGKELLSTAAFIVGDIPATAALSITGSESADEIRERMSAAITSVDGDSDGVIVLTDMFGGTPANVALSFLDERRVEVITGVNLPMVLKLSNARSGGKTLFEAAQDLAVTGQRNIIFASDLLGKQDRDRK
ncbi:MAG: PTS sugar transporter subunit IIA [Myxococcales bacterium]|jgi:PTS system mannose-specific IIA component|nr:PTS sugar transporter subunit IIA [Myxococcales bacterium]